jgi:hypothetical protein
MLFFSKVNSIEPCFERAWRRAVARFIQAKYKHRLCFIQGGAKETLLFLQQKSFA